ncbi:BspA family leucine-rich repeat surface protein, partial [Enterococcus faecalis]|nr:BspA family leucine-rich repeat surface protein [Enterococcus faecalis]
MKNKLKLFSTTLLLTSQILFPMNGLAETSHEKNDAIANPGIFSETDQKTNKKEGGELSQDSQITAQETTTSSLETQESLSTLEKATIYSNDIVTGINGTSEWSFENGTLTFTGGALTQAISKMTEIDPQTITKINFAGPVTIPSLWSETSSFFANLSKLTGIDNGSNLDFSNISEPYYLFRNDTNLEYIDTSNWDTSSMIRTTGMFLGCTNLKTVDVSNWDTSNVVDLGNMFSGCRSIDNLDVSNWDTSKVTNLDKTFYNTNNLSSLDVSNWDTSNVTNMSQLFAGSALSVLDLSNWNTLKNTHAERMLYLPNLKQLALGKNVILTSSYGNASIAPLSATDEYTGYWQTVGPGSIEKPLGDIVIDSQTLSATYDGSSMSGLYVWQPVTLLGSDYTMYLGDSTPTVADFNASATDKNGTPIQVKADFSNVDFSKVGTYDVILSSADGQTKTVTLTIKENKQSISG